MGEYRIARGSPSDLDGLFRRFYEAARARRRLCVGRGGLPEAWSTSAKPNWTVSSERFRGIPNKGIVTLASVEKLKKEREKKAAGK